MAEAVVDVLEVIEIEKYQGDLLFRRAVRDGSVDQFKQLRAVRQPGQHVVIGEAGDLGAGFLALDRQRTEVNAGVDDPLVPAAGRPALPEIEGEGPDHTAVLGLDRCRPAGLQADLERPRLVRLPARIGVEIFGQCRLAEICRRSARTDIRADGDAFERAGIVVRQAGSAQRVQQPVGIDVQQRSDDIRRNDFDAPAQLVGNLGQWKLVGQRAQDQLLQRPQLLFLADIAQQGENVFDTPATVAEGPDRGRDPDLVAVLVVGEDFLPVAASFADPAAQPEQGLAAGERPGEQLVGLPSLRFLGRIPEHAGERRIGIDDAQVAIGEDDGAGGLVGNQVQTARSARAVRPRR